MSLVIIENQRRFLIITGWCGMQQSLHPWLQKNLWVLPTLVLSPPAQSRSPHQWAPCHSFLQQQPHQSHRRLACRSPTSCCSTQCLPRCGPSPSPPWSKSCWRDLSFSHADGEFAGLVDYDPGPSLLACAPLLWYRRLIPRRTPSAFLTAKAPLCDRSHKVFNWCKNPNHRLIDLSSCSVVGRSKLFALHAAVDRWTLFLA